MDKEKAALSRVRIKASTLENSLMKRIAACLNALTEEERTKFVISPTPSMNSTYNEEPSMSSTPLNASTVVRRTGQPSNTSVNSLWSLDSDRLVSPLDAVQEELNNSIASLPNRRSRNALKNPYTIMEDS